MEEGLVEKSTFTVLDYIVFSLMLIGSAAVGMYYIFNNHKKKPVEQERDQLQQQASVHQTTEYLLGNKKMSPLPVALSLISSYISAVTILGTPAEIYNYGTQYWMLFIAIWLMGIVVAQVYVPVFFKLDVKSSYEYLEFRFHRYVRTIVSILYIIDEILFLPMVVYVPSLAFEQGTEIMRSRRVSFTSCYFDENDQNDGGLKAVIWTDSWQILVMTVSAIAIAVLGTISVGGVETMWNRASEGGRLIFFNTNPDLTERQTIWSVLIGGFTFWTSYNAVHQTMVQRYVSLPTLKKSKITVLIFAIGVSFFVTTCSYTGLVIYAAYWKCDPIKSHICKTDDQMLPAFVTQFLDIPGISGLFIAGIFGAGLSSLSVILNSTAVVILEDIIKSLFQINLTDRSAKIAAKTFILLLGLHTVLGVYVVENLSGVLSVATSFNAIAAGTTFGLFSLGMLIPFANTRGAIAGGIAGAIVSATISIGTQYCQGAGLVTPHTKLPISIEECSTFTNLTSLVPVVFSDNFDSADSSSVPYIFRMSYLWIAPFGFLTVMTVGVLVSLTKGGNYVYAHPDYYSPVVHRFLPRRIRNLTENDNIDSHL